VIRISSLGAIRKALGDAAQTGKLSMGVRQWLPVSQQFQLRVPDRQEFSYSVVPGDGIGKALYWQGVGFLGSEFQAFYRMISGSRLFVDVGGTARLLVPTGEIPTEASLELRSTSAPGGWTRIDTVSTTLDAVCAQVTADFIKIDVGGLYTGYCRGRYGCWHVAGRQYFLNITRIVRILRLSPC